MIRSGTGASLLLSLPTNVTACHLHFVTVAAPLGATAEARKLINLSSKHVSRMQASADLASAVPTGERVACLAHLHSSTATSS